MLSAKEQAILRALEPQAQQEGIEVVTVEVVGAKKSPTIRVYIDTPEGVSFDELSQAQSWIDGIVEQLDPFPGAYMLEALRALRGRAGRGEAGVALGRARHVHGRAGWREERPRAHGVRRRGLRAALRSGETRPSQGHCGLQQEIERKRTEHHGNF